MGAVPYVVDPADPRAPPQEVWDRMTEEERRRVVANLPSEIPRALPPEGDAHRIAKKRALETLDEFFRRRGRRVYLGSELAIYYPGEVMFAPDVIAVLDVDPHPRERWVVSDEGRGLDLVIEIHVSGQRQKDAARNVELYARLGIPEYFIYLPRKRRLAGYSLPDTNANAYEPILPQGGLWRSNVLDLELGLEEGRLRFYSGTLGALPDARELIDRLSSMVDDVVSRAEAEERRAEAEARRAEAEARRAEAEARRAEAEAARAERLAAKLRELGVDPDSIE